MKIWNTTGRRLAALASIGIAATLTVTACSGQTGGADASGGGDQLSIAVLLASSQNGYNQAIAQGVQEGVDELGIDAKVTVLDGGFNSDTQLSQLETAGTGANYDGVIVVPNDGAALAAAFPLGNGIPVVTVLNPIGPDITQMEPQVEGVVSTIAISPADAAAKQAEDVVTYCKDIDPCKVAILVGFLSTPLDVARDEAYKKVLGGHDNIQVVATVEGNYDPDASAAAIGNVLQANPDLNVVLSNADQQTSGAQIAFEEAGIDPASIYLSGGGGTTSAVEKVRAGTWKADYLAFPVSMGKEAMRQLNTALTGGTPKTWINQDDVLPGVDPYATKKTLDETPDFTGEWAG